MKKLLSVVLCCLPIILFGQGMNINWEDSSGREFSINTHTHKFAWSMIAGDDVTYNNAYSGGPSGTVKSIGPVRIEYNNAYSGGPDGSVKSVGDVRIYYNSGFTVVGNGGPDGTVKSVGGLTVLYNNGYTVIGGGGPAGSIRGTSGSVN